MEACIEISYSRKKGYLLLYNLNVFFNIWFKKLKKKKKKKEKVEQENKILNDSTKEEKTV